MKNDLISRADAIRVVSGLDSSFVKYIEELPSAQPDVSDTNVGDMISRQVVLNEIEEWISALYENAHHESASDGKLILNAIKHLPSAQPEIIRCRDCSKYRRLGCPMGITVFDAPDPDGYCYKVERRTDG